MSHDTSSGGFFGSGGLVANLHDPGNFFGPQDTEHFQLDTLTPEQKKALDDLIARLSGAERREFQGDPNVELSGLSQTSLAGLENRALQLSDPKFQTDLNKQETDTLMQLLDFQGQQAGVNAFFDSNIRDPALESFREDVLPSIGRDFGGGNFFGSERRSADQRAQEELIDSLTRSRADINFRADQTNRDRALQALGLSTQRTSAQAAERLGIFGAGMEETALAERNVSRQFEQFLAEAGLEDEQIKQLLASISIPQFENIVIGGTAADGGGAASAVGAVAGLFSDIRLKEDIELIGRFMGINIYIWKWNRLAKFIGINSPTVGVIAQEVMHTRCVTKWKGLFKVNYKKLFGGASWQQ